MSDNPDKKLTVSIEADRQAAAETAALLREHTNDTRRVVQAYKELRAAGDDLGTGLERSVKASTAALEESEDAIRRLRDEYIKAADSAGKLKQQHTSLSGGGLLRPGAQILGGLGLRGAAEPLRLTHDFQEISEQFKRLQSAADTGALSVKGLVTGLGPLAAVAIAVTLAMKDLELIMELLKQQADKLVAEEEGRYNQQQKEIEKREQNLQESKTQTGEQVQEGIDKNLRSFAEQQTVIDGLQERIKANNQAIKDLGTVGLDPISAAIYAVKRHPLDALAEQLNKELADAMQRQNEAGGTAIDKGTNVKPLVDAREAQGKFITETLAQWSTFSKNLTGTITKDFKEIEDATAKHRTEIARILKEAETAHKHYEDTVKREADAVAALNEIQKAHADWQSQQVIEEARETYRNAVEKEYADKIAAARREESEQEVRDKLAQDNAKAVESRDAQRNEIDQQYFDRELQALNDFTEQQAEAEDRGQKERLKLLRDGQRDLKSLAAAGDVAGFVERRQKLQDALDDQKSNADEEARQRIAAYQKESAAAAREHDKRLRDLESSFAKENAAREKAAEDRIAAIEASGQQANSKSAQLEQELNAIREQWRRQDLETQRTQEEQNWQERVTNAQNGLNAIRDAENQAWIDWTNLLRQSSGMGPMQTPADREYSQTAFEAEGQEFAIGIPSVGKEGYYRLHPRERVLNERENYDYTFGSQSQPVNVYISNTVGDLATKTMLDEYQETTVRGVDAAWRVSKGLGRG